MTRNSRLSASRSKSSTETMFGCWSCALICASAMNICANVGLSENPGSTRLIATRREKPSAPTVEPRNTSAIRPPPSRVSKRYFPEFPSIGPVHHTSARNHRVHAALAHLAAPRLDQLHERIAELGIELRPRAALDLADRHLVAERPAIRAIRRHRVVRVGDRDDASDERDVLALEAAWIAAAVEPLVMAPAAVDEAVQAWHRLEDALALLRVLAKHRDFFGRELAGLVEHVVADTDLADVVHDARLHDTPDLRIGQRQPSPEDLRVHRDAFAVAARVHVALFERLCEPGYGLLEHLLERRVRDRQALVRRAQLAVQPCVIDRARGARRQHREHLAVTLVEL